LSLASPQDLGLRPASMIFLLACKSFLLQ
jgi:hypothetical protein